MWRSRLFNSITHLHKKLGLAILVIVSIMLALGDDIIALMFSFGDINMHWFTALQFWYPAGYLLITGGQRSEPSLAALAE